MDDLQTLAAVLSPPEPSAAVIERGRRQPTAAIGGTALVLVLNLVLLAQTLGVELVVTLGSLLAARAA